MRVKQETAYNNFVLARLLMAIEKMGYTHRGYGVMIAEATGFTRKDVSFILNGQKRLTYQFLQKFCTAFGISEAWLIEGEGDIFTEKNTSCSATETDTGNTCVCENVEASVGRSKDFS
jgi:plasmid maintenance system antidote protein VapI